MKRILHLFGAALFLIILLLFLIFSPLWAGPENLEEISPEAVSPENKHSADEFTELTEKDFLLSREKKSFTPREILTALGKAYPDKVGPVYRDGDDWTLLVDGKMFYWAQGRLLPKELKDKWEEYDPYNFYSYSRDLPPLRQLTQDEQAALEERLRRQEISPLSRQPGFYEAVWNIYGPETGYRNTKTIFFLGLKIDVHQELLEELVQVEDEITALMETDAEVRNFVNSLGSAAGYNYRRIAGTSTLSFHSLGVAVDLIPHTYGGTQAYWRWAKSYHREWWAIPYSRRFMPPESFIRAFENNGFIWGGKWFMFDNIHFEYRPEILILNGIEYVPQRKSGVSL